MGIVSGLSLGNDSDAGSFLPVHVLLSQDGFQQGGFWEDMWHFVLTVRCTFVVRGGLLDPCSLPGSPVVK